MMSVDHLLALAVLVNSLVVLIVVILQARTIRRQLDDARQQQPAAVRRPGEGLPANPEPLQVYKDAQGVWFQWTGKVWVRMPGMKGSNADYAHEFDARVGFPL